MGQGAGHIGLRGVAAVLPPVSCDLHTLSKQNQLVSTPQTLAALGFDRAYVADDQHDLRWLARTAVQQALQDAQLAPEDIDLVIFASAVPGNHLVEPAPALNDCHTQSDVLRQCRYIAPWLQEELQLHRADVFGVTQQGCSGMFSALRTARAMLIGEPTIRHVLCVGADVLPRHAPREIMYNLISDAGCAVVLSRGADRDRWLGLHQISKGYYWDALNQQPEIIAAYFPTAQATINELLERENLKPDQIDVVIPTGVSRPSWEVLMRLTGIDPQRVHHGPRSFGHTMSADNFLLLQELRKGNLKAGSKLLLFTYGFGSTWSALLLEH